MAAALAIGITGYGDVDQMFSVDRLDRDIGPFKKLKRVCQCRDTTAGKRTERDRRLENGDRRRDALVRLLDRIKEKLPFRSIRIDWPPLWIAASVVAYCVVFFA